MGGRARLFALTVAIMLGTALSVSGVTSSLRFSHRTHYDHAVACERCHVVGPDPLAALPLPGGWLPLEPSRIIHGPNITIEGDAGKAGGPTSGTVSGSTPGSTSGTVSVLVSTSASASASTSTTPSPGTLAPTFGRPPEKTCMQCHFRTRRHKDCGLCHLGPPGPTERDRSRLPPPMRFPHEAHAKSDCLDCHPKVSDWETLDGKMQDSSMAGCLACHNGVKVKKTCVLCHDPTPRPKDHVRNFENKHGLIYRMNPGNCRTCHEDSNCVSCHSQKPRSHTLAWVSRRHGLTAMSNPDSCKACHTDPHICLRCHDDWKSP